ncbi:MAG: hypothetical protein L6R42_007319 [Xanthoria sp. 1 TBL-2021]|nr:MAG: hypothetical protein L6R42_007319 [Xanthoria sp. 1 TBL-2021]
MAVAAPIPDVAAHRGTTSIDAGPSTATATAFSTLTIGSTSSTPRAAATGVFTYTGTAITVSGTSIVVPSASATFHVFPPPVVVVVEAARSLPSASGLSAELVHVGAPHLDAVHFDAEGHIAGSADSVHVGAPEHSSAGGLCAECAHVSARPIHIDADGHITDSTETHHVGAPAHVSVTPGQFIDTAAGRDAHMGADDGPSADGNWCVGAPHCTHTEDHHHSARDRVVRPYSFAAHGGHSSSSSSSPPAGVAAASAHVGTNASNVSADGNYGIAVPHSHAAPRSAALAEHPYRFAAHGGHSPSPPPPSPSDVAAASAHPSEAILPRATAPSVDGNHGIGVPPHASLSAEDSCVGSPHCQHPASPSPSPSAESGHAGTNATATAVTAGGNYGVGVPSAVSSASATLAEHGVGALNPYRVVRRGSEVHVSAEDGCVGSWRCIHGHLPPSPSPFPSTTSAEGGCVGCLGGVRAGGDGGD